MGVSRPTSRKTLEHGSAEVPSHLTISAGGTGMYYLRHAPARVDIGQLAEVGHRGGQVPLSLAFFQAGDLLFKSSENVVSPIYPDQ